jgi:uncharacterized membrane protein YgcG
MTRAQAYEDPTKMIDGLFKRHIDPLWESLSTPLVRARMTPNQVTATGLVLICLASLAYLWHGNAALFGGTLAVSFAFDALDGAVARRRDMCTRSGGYFDAMVDRYQELVVLAAIATVHDLWALALFAFSGGVLTSYARRAPPSRSRSATRPGRTSSSGWSGSSFCARCCWRPGPRRLPAYRGQA